MLPTTLTVVAFLAVLGYIAYDSKRRLPRGAKGPRIGYIPRPLRPALNRLHERRAWPEPFDEDGNRNPS